MLRGREFIDYDLWAAWEPIREPDAKTEPRTVDTQ